MDTPLPERRQDVNTRKVIEVVTEHIDAKIDEKLKGFPSWPAASGLALSVLGLAALIATAIASPSKEKAAEVATRQAALETSTAAKLEKLVDAIGKLEVSAAEQRATYRVVVEGVSRARAKAEVAQPVPPDR